MSGSIEIAVKVRPLIKREEDENLSVQWEIEENCIMAIDKEIRERDDGRFTFDHIFNTDASNEVVFDSIVKPIVDATVNGFNGTVLVCGETGSGKTYTMLDKKKGIISIAIKHMFNAMAKTSGRKFLVSINCDEIYESEVSDLSTESRIVLDVHHIAHREISVHSNKKTHIANYITTAQSIIHEANRNKKININKKGNRSHIIFQIKIESQKIDLDDTPQRSELNMIELAGLEMGHVGNLHVNYSLSTLAFVIGEPQESQEYIDFQDNELTKLLQASVGSNALTAIIYTITPATLHETQRTLLLASKAKNMKTTPQPIAPEVVFNNKPLDCNTKKIFEEQTANNTELMLTESSAPEIVSNDELLDCNTKEIFEEQTANNTESMLTEPFASEIASDSIESDDKLGDTKLMLTKPLTEEFEPSDKPPVNVASLLADFQDRHFNIPQINEMVSLLLELNSLLREQRKSKTLTDESRNGISNTSNDISNISNISKDIIKAITFRYPTTTSEELKDKSANELFKIFLKKISDDYDDIDDIIAISEYWRIRLYDIKGKFGIEKEQQLSEIIRKNEEMTSQRKELNSKADKLEKDLRERVTEYYKLEEQVAKLQDLLQQNDKEIDALWDEENTIERDIGMVIAELKRYKINTKIEYVIVNRKTKISDILLCDKKEVAIKLKVIKEELYKKNQEAKKYLDQMKNIRKDKKLTDNNLYEDCSEQNMPWPNNAGLLLREQRELINKYQMCRDEIETLQNEIQKHEMKYQDLQLEEASSGVAESECTKLQNMFDEAMKLLHEAIKNAKQSKIENEE